MDHRTRKPWSKALPSEQYTFLAGAYPFVESMKALT